jgi:hypothetical protein
VDPQNSPIINPTARYVSQLISLRANLLTAFDKEISDKYNKARKAGQYLDLPLPIEGEPGFSGYLWQFRTLYSELGADQFETYALKAGWSKPELDFYKLV